MKRGILVFSLVLISILFISGCDLRYSFRDSETISTCILENQGDCPQYDQDGNLIVNVLDVLLFLSSEMDRFTGHVNATIQIQNVNIEERTLDIHLTNDGPIGGFQFEILGVEVTGADGGISEEYDWMVSSSSSTNLVLGFSLSGNYISQGEGILTMVSFNNPGDEICFGTNTNNNILSDSVGGAVNTIWGDCYCTTDEDCFGVCGGDAVVGECGVCGGNNINENEFGQCDCSDQSVGDVWADCLGDCGGDAEKDMCGVCDGDGSSCADPINCGDSFFPGYLDENIYSKGGCRCTPNEWYDYECEFEDSSGKDIGLNHDYSFYGYTPSLSCLGNELICKYCELIIDSQEDRLIILGDVEIEEINDEKYYWYSYVDFSNEWCLNHPLICNEDIDNNWWLAKLGSDLREIPTYYDIPSTITCLFAYCSELGDTNGDGGYNVLDIIILANYILPDDDSSTADFVECAGDMNQDGGLNVMDVVTLANCILAENCGE